MIEVDLQAFLSGVVPGGRVSPLVIPQGGDLPAVAYQRISSPSSLDSSGVVALVAGRFQFRAVGKSYKDAKVLAKAVETALDGFKGVIGGSTIGAAWRESYTEYHEPDTGFFTVIQDFNIHFRE